MAAARACEPPQPVQWPFASPTGTSVPEGELLEPRTSALARSRRGAADGDDTLFALTDRFLSAAATTNDVAATSYMLGASATADAAVAGLA